MSHSCGDVVTAWRPQNQSWHLALRVFLVRAVACEGTLVGLSELMAVRGHTRWRFPADGEPAPPLPPCRSETSACSHYCNLHRMRWRAPLTFSGSTALTSFHWLGVGCPRRTQRTTARNIPGLSRTLQRGLKTRTMASLSDDQSTLPASLRVTITRSAASAQPSRLERHSPSSRLR